MTNDAPKPPAGWYPTPDGGSRYWDGENWSALPAPTESVVVPAKSRVTRSRKTRTVLILSVIGAIIIAGGIAGGLIWKTNSDAVATAAAAEAERAAVAEAEERAAKLENAQKIEDDRERELRAASVTEIQNSVKSMAEGHVKDGLVDGPILRATCSPVGGGSTDDLSEKTTVFDCFVANKDNPDGTSTGYSYNATMNWDTGNFTYSIGKA